MKKTELAFAAIQVPLDFLMLVLAAISAYYIRFQSFYTELSPVIYDLPFRRYMEIILPVALGWLIIFALAGLYKIKSTRRIIDELAHVIFACSTGVMAIIIYIFLKRELFSSRFVVLAGWIVAIIFVFIGRIIIIYAQRAFLKRGIGNRKVVLVGNSKTGTIIKKELLNHPAFGYEIAGEFDRFDERALDKIVREKEVDEIIQTDQNMDKEEILNLLDFTSTRQISFKYTADLFGTKVIKSDISTIADIPVVEIKRTPLDGWGRIIKRIFDIIGAILAIIIFSPIMIATAIAIKIDSNGPILYLDYRYGQKFKKFIFYKFRSMKAELCDGEGPSATKDGNAMLTELVNCEKNTRCGPLHKIKDDPRITRVGKFIRKFSLDEFPGFFNVLKGDMSLIGPRPHMSLEVAKYKKHHRKLFEVKPGVTGLSQISGRSDLDFEDEVRLETYYIENWSLKMDITILLKTPFAVLRKRRVE